MQAAVQFALCDKGEERGLLWICSVARCARHFCLLLPIRGLVSWRLFSKKEKTGNTNGRRCYCDLRRAFLIASCGAPCQKGTSHKKGDDRLFFVTANWTDHTRSLPASLSKKKKKADLAAPCPTQQKTSPCPLSCAVPVHPSFFFQKSWEKRDTVLDARCRPCRDR